jgi:hypothetical protein
LRNHGFVSASGQANGRGRWQEKPTLATSSKEIKVVLVVLLFIDLKLEWVYCKRWLYYVFRHYFRITCLHNNHLLFSLCLKICLTFLYVDV